MVAIQVYKPVDVVAAPALTITEYIGRVASNDARVSACVATVTSPTEEAFQAPDFDEFVMVLEGVIDIVEGDGVTRVSAGEGFVLPAGTRVKWRWPGPCKYVPICIPAFSPTNCNREEEANVAKTEESMDRLRSLHKNAAASTRGVAVHYQLPAPGFYVGLAAGALLASLVGKMLARR